MVVACVVNGPPDGSYEEEKRELAIKHPKGITSLTTSPSKKAVVAAWNIQQY